MARKKLKYGSGIASIEMDNTLEELVKRTLDKGYPGVRQEIERTTRRLHDDAYVDWPVKTGRSRAALGYELRLEGDAISGSVYNDVNRDGFNYAYAIRTPEEEGSEHVWSKLIRTPGRKAGEQLAEDLGPILADVAKGD